MVPGEIRQCPVVVGRHEAPTPASLPGFLTRWTEAHGRTPPWQGGHPFIETLETQRQDLLPAQERADL